MEAPRDAIISKVREWVAHADDDLRVAQHTLTLADKCPYRLVAYHAQQCAEKYLKGFLVLHGVDIGCMTDSAGPSSRRDAVIVAQRFIAGNRAIPTIQSPGGTDEGSPLVQSSLRDLRTPRTNSQR